MGYATFLILLMAYNNVANVWPPFIGPLYVPLNCIATTVVLSVGIAGFGLSAEQVGLNIDVADVLVGIGLGLIGVAILSLGLVFRAGRRRLADERVAHLSGLSLMYQVLVRIPIGTAVFEEVAFRGVAFAGLQHLGTLQAALVSSAAFGVWHIAPTNNLIEANKPDATPRARLKAIAGAVVFTFFAGLVLCWLRVESDSLSSVVLLHATLNSGATLLAVRAHRLLRAQRETQPGPAGGSFG